MQWSSTQQQGCVVASPDGRVDEALERGAVGERGQRIVPRFELDGSTGRLKFNPLANWTRAELDAYYARLYGLTKGELRYILDPTDLMGPDYPSETFRVLKNNEIRQFGEYRTQRLVLVVDFGGGTLDLALVNVDARNMEQGQCDVIAKEGRQPAQELLAEWSEVLKPLVAQPAPLPVVQ